MEGSIISVMLLCSRASSKRENLEKFEEMETIHSVILNEIFSIEFLSILKLRCSHRPRFFLLYDRILLSWEETIARK